MVDKSSGEYYNLEKVAEVLSVPTAEVNRLREQNKLRGFRDGVNWKFRKEEIHSYLAESIKARGSSGVVHVAGESDFDLGGDIASSSSFDLMEDAVLPGDSDLVSVATQRPKSDLDLAALDKEDSELLLAEETHMSSITIPPKKKISEGDSSQLILDGGMGSSVDESGSILEFAEEKSSSSLGLAGDSGFDVLAAGEEDNLLQVAEGTEAVNLGLEEDFSLKPSSQFTDDDSESSSQVIAIDIGSVAPGQDQSFTQDSFSQDSFSDINFDDGSGSDPFAGGGAAGSEPFGAGGAAPFPEPGGFPASGSPSAHPNPSIPTEEFSNGMLIVLACTVVILLGPAVMFVDMMVSLWSWNEPFILNSALMSMISGWFGL